MGSVVDSVEEAIAEAGGVAPGGPILLAGGVEAGVPTCKGEFIFTKTDGAAICEDYAAQSHARERERHASEETNKPRDAERPAGPRSSAIPNPAF